MTTPTPAELARPLGIPRTSVPRLLRLGHIRQDEAGEWIVERPPRGRQRGQYGRGLKAERKP